MGCRCDTPLCPSVTAYVPSRPVPSRPVPSRPVPPVPHQAEVLVAEILDVHPQYVNAVYQLPEADRLGNQNDCLVYPIHFANEFLL